MGFIKLTLLVLVLAIAFNYLWNYFKTPLPPVVEGYFHPKFRRVAEKLRQNVQNGKEKGCSFSAYYNGELLIDMWAGYADRSSQQPWNKDTITLAFSVTKSVAAVTIAVMVDKGWIEYEKPVSYYWPEFAKNGKENITVEILLSHQAGLVSFGGEKVSIFDVIKKPKKIIKLLEDNSPEWTPGTAHGYHAVVMGYYVNILAQKADPKHRNISQIFQEEIADPLEIDFHIGIAKEQHWRVARFDFNLPPALILQSLTDLDSIKILSVNLMYPDSITSKAITVLKEDNSIMNRADVQAIGIPSYMGLGTAQSLAKLYSYIAVSGSYKGKQLLTSETTDKLLTPMAAGKDQVLLTDITYSRGLMVFNTTRGNTVFGHSGFGGQIVMADPNKKLSVAYLSNYISSVGLYNDPQFTDLYELVYECLSGYTSD